jgi:hypothetical protein
MIYGIRSVLGYLLGTDKAERNFAVYGDDTFLVSYPRSGNTWTRFLIANLMYPGERVTFANIERLIPDTASQSNRALKRTPRPRIIKTHQYFDHRYGRMIYIVRDPRDVALSYYDFHRKYRTIEDSYPLEAWVKDFVRGNLTSADWGTWGENVASWFYTRGRSADFLLLRYEDMVENTPRELARIAHHLGVEVTADRLDEVIRRSSADRMRELEKVEENEWVATKKHRKDIPFIRVAKAGGWRTKLPEPCVALIESSWGDLMSTLGYELVSTGAPLTNTMGQQEEVRRT